MEKPDTRGRSAAQARWTAASSARAAAARSAARTTSTVHPRRCTRATALRSDFDAAREMGPGRAHGLEPDLQRPQPERPVGLEIRVAGAMTTTSQP